MTKFCKKKKSHFRSISFKTCMTRSHYMWNLKFIYISMMLQLDIWLKYINECINFSRLILLSLVFPLCLDVLPFTIPVPGSWLGCCINGANVQVCTCMQVSKPKPGARGLMLWEYSASQHSGSEFLESCVVPHGCELNSKGPVQHHLPACTFFSHSSWSGNRCCHLISHRSGYFGSSLFLPHSPLCCPCLWPCWWPWMSRAESQLADKSHHSSSASL